jgi:cell filamentation protein
MDWSKIRKENYMNAMIISKVDSSVLKQLIPSALTTKINDREMFMKGIDSSYYYEA